MRNTSKKLLAMLLAGTMSLTLLTACGSAKTAQSSTDTDSTQAEEPATLDYPTKDITVIVPYGAGGTTDLCVRGVLDAVPDGTISSNFMVSNVTVPVWWARPSSLTLPLTATPSASLTAIWC